MLTSLILALAVATDDSPTIVPINAVTPEIYQVPSEQPVVLDPVFEREFTHARAINPKAPTYPPREARRGREGWVIVSYVVDSEGKVANAVIDDSSGSENFEGRALAAALQTEYTPATHNGVPVESCNNRRMYTFELYDRGSNSPEMVASRRYSSANNRAVRAYSSQDWEAFQEAVAELTEVERHNFYEEANFNLLSGLSMELKNDKTGALAHYRRAIRWGAERLSDSNAVIVIQRAFALLIEQQDYTNALGISHNIPEKLLNEPAIQQIKTIAAQIDEQLANQAYIVSTGELSERGAWSHRLMRPVLEFAVDQGKVDAFELRCSGKYKRYEYTNQGTLSIPSSWGACSLRLEGEPNTQVSIYEFKE